MSHDTGYPPPGPDRRADLTGWAILGRVSPRDHVRLAAVASDGEILNDFSSVVDVCSAEPGRPWAMYLTDDIIGRQHYVVFDLDSSRGNAAADAAIVVGWLQGLGIEHTVCRSGPSGGRHVWLSLVDAIPPSQARALALTAALVLPTLDRSSTSGCVRPPGSPHRHGGCSEILTGPIGADVLRPAVTAVQIDALHEIIAAAAATAQPRGAVDELPDGHRPILVDDDGAPHLPGRRRALSPAIAAALSEIPEDPSRTLRRILVGAAAARWHRGDLVDLVATAPGLEHVRSRRLAGAGVSRTPRTALQQQATLARKWATAVRWAAEHPPQTPQEDPTWPHRAGTVGELVDAVQARADASPGRWSTTRTGPSARRVLDAVCLLVVTAVASTVEADVRRVAIATGLGRETVRVRLHELATDGWLVLVAPAAGRRAHHWALAPSSKPVHELYPHPSAEIRSQGEAAPRSPHPSSTLRDAWLATLQRRLTDVAHDLWTPAGLGPLAGMVYSEITDEYVTVTGIADSLHLPPDAAAVVVTVLARYRLVLRDRAGRVRRARRDRRTRVAEMLDVAGQLADRAERYQAEKALWAWWCDEVEWMRLPSTSPAKRRRRMLATGQLVLGDARRPYGPMPRAGGKVDHAAARAQVFAAA